MTKKTSPKTVLEKYYWELEQDAMNAALLQAGKMSNAVHGLFFGAGDRRHSNRMKKALDLEELLQAARYYDDAILALQRLRDTLRKKGKNG